VRDFAKFSPCFWTGDFGKSIRGQPILQSLACYLISAPSGNLTGLFSLPVGYVATDTGHTPRQVLQGLRELSARGFAHYDEEQETVWVVEQARHELGDALDESDNKVKAVKKLLLERRKSFLVRQFLDVYAAAYHLQELLEMAPPTPHEAPSEAPCEAPPKGASRVRHARTHGFSLGVSTVSSPSSLPESASVEDSSARARATPPALNTAAQLRRERRVPLDWLAVELPPDLAKSEAFCAAWATRLQERAERQKRDQPTPTQLACQLRKLSRRAAAHGIEAAVAAVEKATERGWKGVDFDDSPTSGGNGTHVKPRYRSPAAERRAQGSNDERRELLRKISEASFFDPDAPTEEPGG
jgi:hypothetical protein